MITFRHIITAASLFLVLASANSHRVKTQQAELRDEYAFIIAGGGTAGLTVADRLTAAFPHLNVLVVEYGDIEPTPGYFEPPGSPPLASYIDYAVPVPTLNNRSAELRIGATVGGSSAINGQFFDRASRHDYDDWDRLAGGPSGDDGADGVPWDWESLSPYFKKSVTFIEPEKELAEALNLTWDYDAAFVPFQWPSGALSRQACLEAGISPRQECAAGDKDGLCWIPASQHPWDSARSHAGQGHYQDVIGDRPNYDLLVRHKVTRVLYPDNNSQKGPPTVEIRSVSDETIFTKRPSREVILSAGAIHTPQILQRSGIGPRVLLQRAGIDVVADLPGVGYNFQDHPSIRFGINLTHNPTPNQDMLNTDPAYLQKSLDQYAERPARGPWTLIWDHQAVFLPLSNVTASAATLAASLREQIANASALSSTPPPGADESVERGYRAQLETLAGVLEHPAQPIIEIPFGGAEFMTSSAGVPSIGILLKPLSRGAVLLNTTDIEAEPVLHYGTLANGLDIDVMASFLPFMRRLWDAATFRDVLGVVETDPGPELDATSPEEVAAWLRNVVVASIVHPCCTAAMMPKEHGGVVGRDLRVHGASGLRVVDASVFPVIPGAHLSATVYATAEKASLDAHSLYLGAELILLSQAADLIVGHWK
ncbi:hypothetical protein PG991_006657 [Apiospora marii]|uniref:Glucose-methanol-choline oxidoreductase N-terminal domain-containing protein n=1 Tax=Apiospora marii TaxID=335849 RepID=A0ABR1RZV7_9PEZI